MRFKERYRSKSGSDKQIKISFYRHSRKHCLLFEKTVRGEPSKYDQRIKSRIFQAALTLPMLDEFAKSVNMVLESKLSVVIIAVLIILCSYLVYKLVRKIVEMVQTGKERRQFYDSLIDRVSEEKSDQTNE